MYSHLRDTTLACVAGLAIYCHADTHYVDISCATPVSPYTNWTTAATAIQNAIDVASAGDTVLVADGDYSNGGRAVYGAMTNRIAITKSLTVRSVNGPNVTRIVGKGPMGNGAIRCAYITNSAVLAGFSLTNGATRVIGDTGKEQSGGGVWCDVGGVVSNCVLSGNVANFLGGGAYYGTLNNCALIGNTASVAAGGAYYGTLNNCALISNIAASDNGGGSSRSTLNNCTLISNIASRFGGGASKSALTNCTLSGNSAQWGGGTSEGMLNNCMLSSNTASGEGGGALNGALSNCTLIGNSARYGGGAINGTFNNCTLSSNTASVSGGGVYSGTLTNCILSGNSAQYGGGAYDGLLANCTLNGNSAEWGGGAGYDATLNNCTLSSNTASGGGGAVYDAMLNTCALIGNISSEDGGGAYLGTLTTCTIIGNSAQWGGGAAFGTLTNCILENNIASDSGGGAFSNTSINCTFSGNSAKWGGGARDSILHTCTVISNSAAQIGGGAIFGTLNNCIFSENSAKAGGGAAFGTLNTCRLSNNTASGSGGGAYSNTLNDCTLSGNMAQWGGGAVYGTLNNCTVSNNDASISGGGVYLGILTNCTLSGNSAQYGGGAYDGTLVKCTLKGNSAKNGGGAAMGTQNKCMLFSNTASEGGGGASEGVLSECVLSNNTAASGGGAYLCALANSTLSGNAARFGGGTALGTLNNCALNSNTASDSGGGGWYGTLNNCTLVGNSALFSGGGAYDGTLNNCIVYFNTALHNANYLSSMLSYCCTTPDPGGTGNITKNPALVGTFRVSVDSPCLRAGNAAFASDVDIDGESWSTPPSIGCDEVHVGTLTGGLSVAISASYTTVTLGAPIEFTANIAGRVSRCVWNFGDGTVMSNRLLTSHAFVTNGLYSVRLVAINESNPTGVSATIQVLVVSRPVHYVNASNATPAIPFATWATAARSIQNAVDAVTIPGALILVTNGVYDMGGRTMQGNLLNRVAITKAITVCSVNGPEVTTIQGEGPMGDNAVRCVYMSDNAVLSGFTLTAGSTREANSLTEVDIYDRCGGGLMCEASAVVNNCVISGNSADYYGGGAFCGTLNNCVLFCNSSGAKGGGTAFSILNNCVLNDNSADDAGGGADSSTLNNCTLTGNSAGECGGVNGCEVNNSIVYFNRAPSTPNCDDKSALRYCCSTPCPVGFGNIGSDPALASASHLSVNSPCLGSGNAAYANGTDIDGERWATCPAMGCDEAHAGVVTGEIQVAIQAGYTTFCTDFPVDVEAHIAGQVTRSVWDFGDGTIIMNRPFVSHAYATTGLYSVVLTAMNESYPIGVSTSVMVLVVNQPVHYVNLLNETPAAPFSTWGTAATNIQNAIDVAAVPGSKVLVSNGVYETGGRVVYGSMPNRLVINKPITVSSVNGPAVTVIVGNEPGFMGYSAMRCVYAGDNVVLSGFTLTNGNTKEPGIFSTEPEDLDGGGVWCESSTVVSNCIISGNSAFNRGGGSYKGTLINCTLTGNTAYSGGGSSGGTLNNCALTSNSVSNVGGGSHICSLHNCVLAGNSSDQYGGGAYLGTLNNCLLTGNSAKIGGGAQGGTMTNCKVTGNTASASGGGVCQSTLENCTLFGNSARQSGGASYFCKLNNCTLSDNVADDKGGGADSGTLNNCIVYFNAAPVGANYFSSALNSCCTFPIAPGTNNVSEPPKFVNRADCDYHLEPFSPCINVGQTQPWMFNSTDLDGRPRILNGSVDMGAFEFAFEVALKGLMQGPYNTNVHVMADELSTNLPLTSPYVADRRKVAATPSNVVDWALVEVQDTNGVSVAATSVFLDPAGRVLDEFGSNSIPVEASAGSYYLVLKHRNHLAAMSALPVAFTNTVVSYDFTTGPDKYFGGTNACVALEPGVWGLVGGDADGDGRITPVDRIIVERQRGRTGYLQGDLNLDGKVDGNDQ